VVVVSGGLSPVVRTALSSEVPVAVVWVAVTPVPSATAALYVARHAPVASAVADPRKVWMSAGAEPGAPALPKTRTVAPGGAVPSAVSACAWAITGGWAPPFGPAAGSLPGPSAGSRSMNGAVAALPALRAMTLPSPAPSTTPIASSPLPRKRFSASLTSPPIVFADERLAMRTPSRPLPTGMEPAASVPIRLAATVLAVEPAISTPFAALPEMTLRASRTPPPITLPLASAIETPLRPLPSSVVPPVPRPM
jgi:hypothetical protein